MAKGRHLTLTMPYPPPQLSPNARQHPLAVARVRRRYRLDCGWAARAQLGPGFQPLLRVRLALRFVCCRRQLPDPDNALAMAKPLLDGLVDAGVLPGDAPAFVLGTSTTVERCPHRWVRTCTQGDRVVIRLEEV